ncbi:glycosyltransferase [Actinocorallia longicatena]|uniref:Glycosyltransferase n=1 Tax=Actinocorallia longicatena TaxID=111803 RepID=A0ABP6QL73_9ACTN
MSTRFGFVSTFPPTQCGLATFTDSLRGALTRSGADEAGVVRLLERWEPQDSPHVVSQWIAGDRAGLGAALDRLHECDLVIVQHEYGVFGGRDGDEVLHLLDGLKVPAVVVLHTVLSAPTARQREVLEAVAVRATAIVVMTATAHRRLVDGYSVDPRKVTVIPHGAPERPGSPTGSPPTFRSEQATILTWGLFGPGKGIEWAVEAMALLRDLRPMPLYLVAGRTHPKVLLHQGESYLSGLRDRARRLGVADTVTFDSRYRDPAELSALVDSADIVLLPYDSTDQITSGVLIEALAAGKPVVATRFPHAAEALADGAGLLVGHRDPVALAEALRTVITRPGLAARMADVAAASSAMLAWPVVAEQYRRLAGRLMNAEVTA